MKNLLLLLVFFALIFACNKDETLNFKDDIRVTTRANKHVQIKVSNPNSTNASGEVVVVFLGVPTCTCVNPGPNSECIESANIIVADGNSDSDFVTDTNGKVKVNGNANGFAAGAKYTACVQYFPATPCNLNNFEDCGNPPDFGKCTFGAICTTFTTNSSAGTTGQVKITKK